MNHCWATLRNRNKSRSNSSWHKRINMFVRMNMCDLMVLVSGGAGCDGDVGE